jgi:RNA recognition motif-containing protein
MFGPKRIGPGVGSGSCEDWYEPGHKVWFGMKNIFVGNLPYSATQNDLEQLFSQHGSVGKAQIIMDRETGRSKGFGFVEMPNDDEAARAIEALNNHDLNGRPIAVNEARPREERAGGGGGRGFGGGGGGRGGFGGGGGGRGGRGGGGGYSGGRDSGW